MGRDLENSLIMSWSHCRTVKVMIYPPEKAAEPSQCSLLFLLAIIEINLQIK